MSTSMEIWVPYTQVAPATRAALAPYQVWWNEKVKYALMNEDEGYPRFLKARWESRRSFINIEHDVVFWDGALEELWNCEHPWCAFAYREDEIYSEDNHTPVFGCCKFSAWFMAATVGVWDAMLANATDRIRNPTGMAIACNPKWKLCDGWLRQWAREEGLFVHQHFPAVENLREAKGRRS